MTLSRGGCDLPHGRLGFGPVEKRDPEKIRKDYQEGIIDDEWLKEAGVALP